MAEGEHPVAVSASLEAQGPREGAVGACCGRVGTRDGRSAASAANSQGGFWLATYSDGLNGERFVELLREMMKGRVRPLHLVTDDLPAHKSLFMILTAPRCGPKSCQPRRKAPAAITLRSSSATPDGAP